VNLGRRFRQEGDPRFGLTATGLVVFLVQAGMTEGGIAGWAHVGGFMAGIGPTPLLRRSPRDYRCYRGDDIALGVKPHSWR
jgi:hypothetical protein